jgi:hypothetical protein
MDQSLVNRQEFDGPIKGWTETNKLVLATNPRSEAWRPVTLHLLDTHD